MIITSSAIKLCVTCKHLHGLKRKNLPNEKIRCESLTNSYKFKCKNELSKKYGLMITINDTCSLWEKFEANQI